MKIAEPDIRKERERGALPDEATDWDVSLTAAMIWASEPHEREEAIAASPVGAIAVHRAGPAALRPLLSAMERLLAMRAGPLS